MMKLCSGCGGEFPESEITNKDGVMDMCHDCLADIEAGGGPAKTMSADVSPLCQRCGAEGNEYGGMCRACMIHVQHGRLTGESCVWGDCSGTLNEGKCDSCGRVDPNNRSAKEVLSFDKFMDRIIIDEGTKKTRDTTDDELTPQRKLVRAHRDVTNNKIRMNGSKR